MRWSALFDDLEAQLLAAERAELEGEVAEHTRAERGRVALCHRMAAATDRALRVHVRGVGTLEGRVVESAREWVVLTVTGPGGHYPVLVRTAAVLAVSGLGPRALTGAQRVGERRPVAAVRDRELDLRQALRALSRDRSLVRVHDVEGGLTAGTIDRVGWDHLDIGTHPEDVPRRSAQVQGRVVLPFWALATVSHRVAG